MGKTNNQGQPNIDVVIDDNTGVKSVDVINAQDALRQPRTECQILESKSWDTL